MCAKCEKKCCANCAHCYETEVGGSYGCEARVFGHGDLLEDDIYGNDYDGDTTCSCYTGEGGVK